MGQALNHNHELQGRHDSAKDLEKNLMQQVSRLLSERDEANGKLRSIELQLAEVHASEKKLSSDLKESLREADMHREK